MRRKSKLTFLLLGITAAVFASCGNSGDYDKEPVTVKVQRVRTTRDTHPQSYVGRVDAGKIAIINSTVSGRMSSLNVKKSQRVKCGDVLGIIDSPTATSLYNTALATYKQAQDALIRVKQVHNTGSVSDLKMVEVETSFEKAKAALSAAKSALDDCVVKAPYDGAVGEILVEEGVEIALGQALFRLMDVNAVEVHAFIPEKEYSSFVVGQKAEIYVDAIGRKVRAVLVSKGVEASPLSHSYDFVFKPLYSDNMMPGMVCKVYMTSRSVSSTVLPSSAVRVDASGRYVWCIDTSGTVVKKHVEVGSFVSDGVEVKNGLSTGDLVVIDGGRRISSGMKNIKVDDCQ